MLQFYLRAATIYVWVEEKSAEEYEIVGFMFARAIYTYFRNLVNWNYGALLVAFAVRVVASFGWALNLWMIDKQRSA